jgi:hypothetical protein
MGTRPGLVHVADWRRRSRDYDYQQVLDMGGAAVGQLEEVLGCTIQEAFVTYSGREGLGTHWAPGPEIPSQGRGQQGDRDAV